MAICENWFERHRNVLVQKINLTTIVPDLVDKGILSHLEERNILWSMEPKHRAEILINLISKKFNLKTLHSFLQTLLFHDSSILPLLILNDEGKNIYENSSKCHVNDETVVGAENSFLEKPFKNNLHQSFYIKLNRDESFGLGITVSGFQRGNENNGLLYISDILPESPASKVLKIGDVIVAIDGLSLYELKPNESVALLKTFDNIIRINVLRPENPNKETEIVQNGFKYPEQKVETCIIKKIGYLKKTRMCSGDNIGIDFKVNVFVDAVTEDLMVTKGGLFAGDEILEISNINLHFMIAKYIKKLFNRPRDTIEFKLKRRIFESEKGPIASKPTYNLRQNNNSYDSKNSFAGINFKKSQRFKDSICSDIASVKNSKIDYPYSTILNKYQKRSTPLSQKSNYEIGLNYDTDSSCVYTNNLKVVSANLIKQYSPIKNKIPCLAKDIEFENPVKIYDEKNDYVNPKKCKLSIDNDLVVYNVDIDKYSNSFDFKTNHVTKMQSKKNSTFTDVTLPQLNGGVVKLNKTANDLKSKFYSENFDDYQVYEKDENVYYSKLNNDGENLTKSNGYLHSFKVKNVKSSFISECKLENITLKTDLSKNLSNGTVTHKSTEKIHKVFHPQDYIYSGIEPIHENIIGEYTKLNGYSNISLCRIEYQPLGFKIEGGNKCGIFVAEIDENGLAHNSGLKIGDTLIKIGQYNLKNVTKENAIKILNTCGPRVDILRHSNFDTFNNLKVNHLLGDYFYVQCKIDITVNVHKQVGETICITKGQILKVINTLPSHRPAPLKYGYNVCSNFWLAHDTNSLKTIEIPNYYEAIRIFISQNLPSFKNDVTVKTNFKNYKKFKSGLKNAKSSLSNLFGDKSPKLKKFKSETKIRIHSNNSQSTVAGYKLLKCIDYSTENISRPVVLINSHNVQIFNLISIAQNIRKCFKSKFDYIEYFHNQQPGLSQIQVIKEVISSKHTKCLIITDSHQFLVNIFEKININPIVFVIEDESNHEYENFKKINNSKNNEKENGNKLLDDICSFYGCDKYKFAKNARIWKMYDLICTREKENTFWRQDAQLIDQYVNQMDFPKTRKVSTE
ncbi:hypothetical protein A3Q56_04102 [Intoshia linei]|uniref:Uncharacterized protein n=1 Tax=Intoshia linei TaxID=1819745 RepID=A0A177B3E6_9BILA|nr:hypothetical protein A3Q56_04102 [Intoshia linei]